MNLLEISQREGFRTERVCSLADCSGFGQRRVLLRGCICCLEWRDERMRENGISSFGQSEGMAITSSPPLLQLPSPLPFFASSWVVKSFFFARIIDQVLCCSLGKCLIPLFTSLFVVVQHPGALFSCRLLMLMLMQKSEARTPPLALVDFGSTIYFFSFPSLLLFLSHSLSCRIYYYKCALAAIAQLSERG